MTCTKCHGLGVMVIPVDDSQGLTHHPRFLCGFCFGTGFENPTWEQSEKLAYAIQELRMKGVVGTE